MSILGSWGTGHIYGKVVQLRTDFDAHAALTGSAAHGAVSAATASQIIVRDGSGRADIVAPPASDNTAKIVTSAWVTTEISASGGGTITSIAEGTGMNFSVDPIIATGTINLANTAVTPNTYVFATITVDAQGRLTAASAGSPVTAVTGSAPVVSSGGLTPQISMVAATASVPGHMSTAFASKLNGIATGAEVNVVDSVFGRTGAVIAVADDYDIQDIGNVTISDAAASGTPADGSIWFEY